MSMHDIEGVVETSVYCIDKSNLPLENKRDLLYNLYKFQAEYDTGYTNFRVKDILLKYHYMFGLPIEVHPDYADRKDEFDNYVQKGYSEWLTDDSILEHEDGKPLFYIDAGSGTWKRLVENGTLTDLQTLPVKDLSIFETILEVVKLCQEQQDIECAAEWFRTILFYLLWEVKEEDHSTLNAIAEILFNDAVLMAAKNDYYFSQSIEGLNEEFDEQNIPENINKWLSVYTEWEKEIENDPATHLEQTIQLFNKRDLDGAFESCKKGLALSPDDPFLLLYEAVISILMLQREKQDVLNYEPWLTRLSELQKVETDIEENDRIIKSHALYYTAYIYLVCGQLDNAKIVAEELINSYHMSEAKELLSYILKVEKQK